MTVMEYSGASIIGMRVKVPMDIPLPISLADACPARIVYYRGQFAGGTWISLRSDDFPPVPVRRDYTDVTEWEVVGDGL